MAYFDVVVRRLDAVIPHPNADRLDLAVIGGYRCVVAKNQFHAGDLVAYLPEASILPDELIEKLGLTGKLAGPRANRIKAVELRGALSQGVVMAASPHWVEGQSVMAELGVEKYKPQIPEELLGAAYTLEEHERLDFDLENIKAYPHLFQEGEQVVLTEKVHGVFMGVGGLPKHLARAEHHHDGQGFVSSKGLLSDRMAFCPDADNTYVRTATRLDLFSKAILLAQQWDCPVLILGELFGAGIQDLAYGQAPQAPAFRVFSIVKKEPSGLPVYLSDNELEATIAQLDLVRAPVLYRGPFSHEVVEQYTTGKESVSGNAVHLREGVVITPAIERSCQEIGRVALKSVSPQYLTRKGGTEYT